MTCCLSFGCAPRIIIPNAIRIHKGDTSPIDGYVLSINDLLILGHPAIENSHN